MFTCRALYILSCFLGLVSPGISAANQSHTFALNVTGTNAYEYEIPNTTPPVTIAVSQWSPYRVTPVYPPAVYMCAIENLGPVCRRNPQQEEMVDPSILKYGAVTIRFDRVPRKSGPYYTHDVVCAVLRGLPEYMTLRNWWVESFVHVLSEGTIIGTAQLLNSQRKGSVAPVELVASDATA